MSGREGKGLTLRCSYPVIRDASFALVGLFPFLSYDKIVFLEPLSRFDARCSLILDTLVRSALVRTQGSELRVLETRLK